MQDPKFESKEVAIALFFVHCFGDRVRIHMESLLVSQRYNLIFHCTGLAHLELRWATLLENLLDVNHVVLADVS